MLREKLHAAPVSNLWFYPEHTSEDKPPYSAVCSLVWASPGVVWVYGLMGHLTRQNMRELLGFCLARGAVHLKANRRDGHLLPGAKPVGDHFDIDLAALAARVGTR